jgi:hypothetical protein
LQKKNLQEIISRNPDSESDLEDLDEYNATQLRANE